MPDEYFYFTVAGSIIAALAIILNAIGLYILSKADLKRSNQLLIIKNLSVSNIVTSITWLLYDAVAVYVYPNNRDLNNRFTCIVILEYFRWISLTFLLTFDRFIGANFPFQYKIVNSEKNIFRVAVTIWICCTFSYIYAVTAPATTVKCDIALLALVLDSLFFMFFIVTYTTICCRIVKSKVRKNRSGPKNGNQKLFGVVFWILTGFVLFGITPDIAIIWRRTISIDPLPNLEYIFIIHYRFNGLFDPLIYVFLQSQARKKAALMLACAFHRKRFCMKDTM